MTNENGLPPPLHSDSLSGSHGPDIKLSGSKCQNVGGCAHGRDEFDDQDASGGGVSEADPGEEEVGEGTTFGFGNVVNTVVGEGVVDGAKFVEGGGFECRGRGVDGGGLERLEAAKGEGCCGLASKELSRGSRGDAGGEAEGVHGGVHGVAVHCPLWENIQLLG